MEIAAAAAQGYVGAPLPSVEVAICAAPTDDDDGGDAEPDRAHRPVAEGEAGELRVRGVGVFQEYLNKPEATAEAFDEEGWFMTGDIARFDPEVGSYQILGRASVDIIKVRNLGRN